MAGLRLLLSSTVAFLFLAFKLQSGQFNYPDFETSMLREGAIVGYTPLKQHYNKMDQELVRAFKENYEKNIALEDDSQTDRIPRIIHQIWLGGEVPEKYHKWMSEWASLQGWTYKLWTDQDIDSLFLYNRDVYELSRNKGEKSDILRLEILAQFGGVYLDVDYECINIGVFEELHRKYDFYIGFEPLEHGVIATRNMFKMCNAVIGSAPQHPLVKHLLVNMKANYLAYYSVRGALERTGPSYLTRIICEYLLNCPDKRRNMYLPCTFLHPFTEVDLRSEKYLRCMPETAGIHYWSGSWRTRDWKNIEDPIKKANQGNYIEETDYLQNGYAEQDGYFETGLSEENYMEYEQIQGLVK